MSKLATNPQPVAAPRAFATDRMALLRRTSSEMVACPRGALGLRVPATSEATANAPVYNINLFDTCTAYPAAPLDVAGGFTVEVARLAEDDPEVVACSPHVAVICRPA